MGSLIQEQVRTSAGLHPREIEWGADFRAYLFGRPQVFMRGSHTAMDAGGRRKAQDILNWFLLHQGIACSAEQFIDMLWPDADPAKALTNFHVTLHALRRVLEPELGPRQESTFIHRHAGKVYAFEAHDRWWTDVDDLELLYQRGHEADLAGMVSRARFYYRRVAGYVGQHSLLEGDRSTWLEPVRRKYAMMCSHSLSRLMELDAEAGDQEELLETAYAILRIDALHEPAVRAVVTSHLSNNKQDRAAHQLETFCRCLRDEVGLRPPHDLVELLDQLRPAGECGRRVFHAA